MRRRITLSTLSTFLGALMALALILPDAARAAGKWDGEWVGKAAYGDGACRGKISLDSAQVTNNLFEVIIVSGGRNNPIRIPLKSNGQITDNVKFSVDYETSNNTGPKEAIFNFSGNFSGNQFEGNLSTSFGTKGSWFCGVNINLARIGTIEATALLTGQDPEILKLERQVAQLNRKKISKKGSKWDGEWVGKIKNESSNYLGCQKYKFVSATVSENRLL
tara:strand:+ start:1009 stop:1668 length:660 start_codon:yes stop_codon:yes gene_type:complete